MTRPSGRRSGTANHRPTSGVRYQRPTSCVDCPNSLGALGATPPDQLRLMSGVPQIGMFAGHARTFSFVPTGVSSWNKFTQSPRRHDEWDRRYAETEAKFLRSLQVDHQLIL